MRLPQPDPIPTRPDEYWRVVPESHMEVAYDGFCTHHAKGISVSCHRPSVAMTRKGTLLLCLEHLRESGMWIEGGIVVSWCLVDVPMAKLRRVG